MKKPLPSFLFYLLGACAFAASTGPVWREFKAQFFSLSFPAPPAQRGFSQWVAADSKGRAYSVNITDLAAAPADPEDYFVQTIEKLSQGSKYEVVYQKMFKGQGLPACEFKMANTRHIVVSRLFLRKNRLYMLQVATDTGTFEENRMGKFFTSFRIGKSTDPVIPVVSPTKDPAPDNQGQAVQPW